MEHVVSKEGIIVDIDKIRAIMDWMALRNVDELAGYCRSFTRNFSHTTYPITSLHRKGKKFEWTKECEGSF